MKSAERGEVFNIQRFSMHDGEGIRTLVFLKGCPLACQWCSNPESQKHGPELGFIEPKCKGTPECDAPCVASCPEKAIAISASGKPVIYRDKCTACGECEKVCPEDALKVVGREMTVAEVMAEIEKDRMFYRRSGGGVTLGGGEPLMQHAFATAVLKAARDEYVHTALETCALVSWEHFKNAIQYVDRLYIDLKHMDPKVHEELTGQSNEVILNNIRQVLTVKQPEEVVVRVPVIPGCNDSLENIKATAIFVAEQGLTQIEMMPYHTMGSSKYDEYGMTYSLGNIPATNEDDMVDIRHLVEQYGLKEVTGCY